MKSHLLITKYQQYLKSLNLKPSTIQNYIWHLGQFFNWLSQKKITNQNLKSYHDYLIKNYTKISTINLRLIILNNYLNFINHHFQFDLLSSQLSTAKILTDQQLQRFLAAPLKDKKMIGLRNKALLELLYATGLKVGQIIKLEKKHLDNIKNEIILDNHTHLNIKSMTWFYLNKYLEARKDNSQWIFINLDRANKSEDKQLSIRSVERILEKYGRQLTPPLQVNPQILRNTLAYQLKSHGLETIDLKQALHFKTTSGAENYYKRI
ncbi:MAG: hypothetical protein COV55_00225 [Candidatus Komeilibacteria bacterium CG11_big_fil_rev_8_21_14_0_20_36_20]|uniref:Integrase n=1 Tax=Candidatus Komeilibacteria bacterium CG11_big_fil_rev_8_21_14_0_20_36_20 TaxID=1974477 RepID=A0A2H0NEM6_9BACT|nr:MAG: hypothetical protein COV55_00225 [Candidatus Komeilibacteria bacterium CG11_big_fil_rev_8_21_14_0_20_36_20]PIR81539.1 MAG: hypothetical protein COU21_03115 [Candidatus Komeilibacteria bacterium CG10_big_fil_rev_8_21_14_0_10_36_65]PJC55447.1 MAG: hypothetical protein CO027_01950 [Candidatus Komeilibacteria bacterium CG_4_9_14_0_2_um_filter_36_13]